MNYEDIPGFQQMANDAATEASQLVPRREVTIVTSNECPPQSHAWVYGNLVCNPVDRERYAGQLEQEGYVPAEPGRQQVRAVERWGNKKLAKLAVAGMMKLP